MPTKSQTKHTITTSQSQCESIDAMKELCGQGITDEEALASSR